MNDVPFTVQVTIVGCMLASGVLWALIAHRWKKSGEILPAVPRTMVPWGAGGTLLAGLLLTTTLLNAALSTGPVDPLAENQAGNIDVTNNYVVQTAQVCLCMLVIVCGGLVILAKGHRATLKDLGLPTSWEVARDDITLGLKTWLALLGPILVIQMVAVTTLEVPAEHPTIMRIMADPSPLTWLAAILAAAIVAPLFEEFAFRLLLQGWLEKAEERTLIELEAAEAEALGQASKSEFAEDESFAGSKKARETKEAKPPARQQAQLPDGGRVSLLGLPLGWPSILVSALAFSLVHLGQGPAPIPLFLFGIILGYVYQRTHRILPCVVAHMAFNAFMLFIVYLSAAGTPPTAG